MTNEELKEALMNRRPVITCISSLGAIEYAYVSAIIYRRDDKGSVIVSAELMDKSMISVVLADPKNISYAEEIEEEDI